MPDQSGPGSDPRRRRVRPAPFLGSLLLAMACGSPSSSPPAGGNGGGSSGGTSSGAASTSSGSGGGSSGASSGTGSTFGGSSGSGSGGSSSSGASNVDGGKDAATSDDGGACAISTSNVRVTEIDVGLTYVYQEVDASPTGGNNIGLALLAISPIPSGGSRVAFMGSDGMVHIAELDANDNLVPGSVFGLPAFEFEDIYADNSGGTVLVTRNAMGGGTNNCGNPANLCSLANPTSDSCWDMYMVRFNGRSEAWATKLTTSSATLPPYSTGPTGAESLMIWWYAHNGRIAFDGTKYAAYYGVAITVRNLNGMSCMDIHQGDEMRIVDPSTKMVVAGGFDVGCSHSAFQRIAWDGTKFVPVCDNDAPTGGKSGKIAFAPNRTTIYPVDQVNTELTSFTPPRACPTRT